MLINLFKLIKTTSKIRLGLLKIEVKPQVENGNQVSRVTNLPAAFSRRTPFRFYRTFSLINVLMYLLSRYLYNTKKEVSLNLGIFSMNCKYRRRGQVTISELSRI
jgi:hypothetical protein